MHSRFTLTLILVFALFTLIPFSNAQCDELSKDKLLSLATSTQKSKPSEEKDSDYVMSGKSSMWKIESESSEIFILSDLDDLIDGTSSIYPLNKTIEKAFDKADTLVVEINPDDNDDAKAAEIILKYGTYKGNDNLERHMSKENYQAIKKRFSSLGLNIGDASKFKYWMFIVNFLMLEYELVGNDSANSLDNYFQEKAFGKKKILALDTFEDFEEGCKRIDSLPDKILDKQLAEIISDFDDYENKSRPWLTAWETGDIKKIEELEFADVTQEEKAFYAKFNSATTTRYIKKIDEFLKTKGKYFIIISPTYIIGDNGVINSLEKKGYKVEQM